MPGIITQGPRIEWMESRGKIISAYKAIIAQGGKATQKAISEASGLSVKTVGKHMRDYGKDLKQGKL